MKRIIILFFLILLVGCQQAEKIESLGLENTISIRWGNGEFYEIENETIIKSFHSVLDGALLEKIKKDDENGYRYFIDYGNYRIVNGIELIYKGERYSLETTVQVKLEELLKTYIPVMKDGLLVSQKPDEIVEEVSDEVTEETFDEEIPKDSLLDSFEPIVVEELTDQYTFAGMLSNGNPLRYRSVGDYYEREMVDQIIFGNIGQYTIINVADSSVPQISPSGDRFMFVHGVGFEVTGDIVVYENDEFVLKTFDGFTEENNNSQTIKEAVWYDENSILAIIGFGDGTVTQGGDVYLINLETNTRTKIIGTVPKQEIITMELVRDHLYGKYNYFMDDNYETYEHVDYKIDLNDFDGVKPLVIEVDTSWEPWNLEVGRYQPEEVTGLPLFNPERTITEVEHLDSESDGEVTTYFNGNVNFLFTEWSEKIWRVDVIGDIDYDMPRDLKVGMTLDEVFAKFPHEKNWEKQENGELYGVAPTSYKDMSETAMYIDSLYTNELLVMYSADTPTIKVMFENGIVVKIEVYYYIST